MQKTNAMQELDGYNIDYNAILCEDETLTNGVDIANAIQKSHEQVFKTLVTIGNSGQNYVFILPVMNHLNLEKAAQATKEISIKLIKQKELFPLTGYVHGGCSPLAMKNGFLTIIHKSAKNLQTIIINAGKIGHFIEINPNELLTINNFIMDDIV